MIQYQPSNIKYTRLNELIQVLSEYGYELMEHDHQKNNK
jgi:hypothetical protein